MTGVVENPATVDDAVRAARGAFAGWARLPVQERVDELRAWHGVLAARHEPFVATTVAEVGAPVAVASEAHVDMGLAVLEAYLDEGPRLAWEEQVRTSVVLREPIGVAACITPRN